MHKRVRELVDYASGIGWELDGVDGRSHYRLRHSNGAVYRLASTPGDRRADLNARADLRRLAGAAHDGPKSGRYRHGVGRRQAAQWSVSSAEQERQSRVRRLLAAHKQACRDLHQMQVAGKREEGAVEVARKLLRVESELDALGVPCPVRSFRLRGEG